MLEVDKLSKTFKVKNRKNFLSKEYVQKEAVKNITFSIGKGKILSLLGKNGAGKSTTLKMLSTIILPTAGEAWIDGKHIEKDDSEIRKTIGVMLSGERSLYWKLTGYENLEYFAAISGIPRHEIKQAVKKALYQVDLTEDSYRLVEEYSTGMKQRLGIARAIINNPKLLILDEPTSGLDPVSAQSVRQTIKKLTVENDLTVIWSTHNLMEAENYSDLCGIIEEGELKRFDTPGNIKSKFLTNHVIRFSIENSEFTKNNKIHQLLKNYSVINYAEDGPSKLIQIELPNNIKNPIYEVSKMFEDNNIVLENCEKITPDLNTIFLLMSKGVGN